MTTDIVRREGEPRGITLQHVVQLTGYDIAQIALIRNSVAKDAPLEELAVFLHAARQLGLDPLARQVYWIRRQGKGSLQVGIDGFRLVAARTKEYAGSEDAVYRGAREIEHNGRKITVPEVASVTVWRVVAGHKSAFTGSARWDEFYPGAGNDGFMYRKMPYHMLGKDAEAQALRKGFAAEMVALPPRPTAEDGGYSVTESPAPELVAANARMYDRAIGSQYDDEAAAPEPPTEQEERGPEAMVTSRNDPAWNRWQVVVTKARAAGVDVPAVELPLSVGALEASTRLLRELIAEAETTAA